MIKLNANSMNCGVRFLLKTRSALGVLFASGIPVRTSGRFCRKLCAASTGTRRKVVDSVRKTRNSKENARRMRKRKENTIRISVARRAIGFNQDICALSVACCRSPFQERVELCVGRL